MIILAHTWSQTLAAYTAPTTSQKNLRLIIALIWKQTSGQESLHIPFALKEFTLWTMKDIKKINRDEVLRV